MATSVGFGGVDQYIIEKAQQYNLPVNLVLGIAICESGLNPEAHNPKDVNGLPDFGLWQFQKKTFYGQGGKRIWDWKEQTNITMKMLKKDMWLHWPVCFKRMIKEINDHNSKLIGGV